MMLPEKLKDYKYAKGKNPIPPLSVSWYLEQSRVALMWGLKPWEFRSLPPDRAAELHATWRVEKRIEAYEASEVNKRMDKK